MATVVGDFELAWLRLRLSAESETLAKSCFFDFEAVIWEYLIVINKQWLVINQIWSKIIDEERI